MLLAWHFTGSTLRDGSSLPARGEWLEYHGECVMCRSGLHASRTPWHALPFAAGPMLHRVEVRDIVIEDPQKLVCRGRRILASSDLSAYLRRFACQQALSVAHLWTPPAIVVAYLRTQNPDLEAPARAKMECVKILLDYDDPELDPDRARAFFDAPRAPSVLAALAARVATRAANFAESCAYSAALARRRAAAYAAAAADPELTAWADAWTREHDASMTEFNNFVESQISWSGPSETAAQ